MVLYLLFCFLFYFEEWLNNLNVLNIWFECFILLFIYLFLYILHLVINNLIWVLILFFWILFSILKNDSIIWMFWIFNLNFYYIFLKSINHYIKDNCLFIFFKYFIKLIIIKNLFLFLFCFVFWRRILKNLN